MAPHGPDADDHTRFERPGRGSRPRTKVRPAYRDAVSATVVAVERGRYTCLPTGSEHGRVSSTAVTAVKARRLGRQGVVVGDRVWLSGDTSGRTDTLARVVEVEPRRTVLRRTADDTDPVERVVVAGADQLVVVTALADPEPRTGLIDRALVAAYDAGLDPLLCLTKADLATPDSLMATYRPLGLPAVVTEHARPLGELRQRLAGRVSVLLGHSGVGKSTLVNALVPEAERATGAVNAVTGRGRHTSASVVMLPVGTDPPGWIIDTPGIRAFGLAHVAAADLLASFGDLEQVARQCPRGCRHGAADPECALDAAVADGRVADERLASFRRLLASRQTPGA